MLKTFCSLCGSEIKGILHEYHTLPRIEETRKTIEGDDVKVMLWVNCTITSGFICPDCKQMYIEKMLQAIATTRKLPR